MNKLLFEPILPRSVYRLKCNDIFKPSVYICWKGKVVQYIGSSKNGLSRAISNGHHKFRIIRDCDNITVYVFDTIKEAKEAERKLIRRYLPPHNTKHITKSGDYNEDMLP